MTATIGERPVRALEAEDIDPKVTQYREHADTAAGEPTTRRPQDPAAAASANAGKGVGCSSANLRPEGEFEPVCQLSDLKLDLA